ncbi:MAG: Do family serine endopeptidase [Gammaproteobacteria bacterium]
MKYFKQFIITFTLLMSIFAAPTVTFAEIPPPNSNQTSNLAQIMKKVMPAVVNISVVGLVPKNYLSQLPRNAYPPNNGAPHFQDVGSGVIVDPNKGYIVTNTHVLRDAQTITVTLSDGRRLRGRSIGSDNASDVAVIQVNAKNLASIPFGDSDKLQVGDFVAAVGNPFGLQQTVTSGVISALNRSDLGIEGYENFIQTDAPINPGNSGGALVNMNGELVGINTAILAPSGANIGIGFAIPSNMVKSVVDQLIRYGKVERGVLGVIVQNLTPDLADAFNIHGTQGALITQVLPNSPAAQAGLKPGDIVEKIDTTLINNSEQLRNKVGLTRIGTPLSLEVIRDGKKLNLKSVVAPSKSLEQKKSPESFISGVRLRDYDQMNLSGQEIKGVQVLDVDYTSSAWFGGLQLGDVILTANNQEVSTISQLAAASQSNKARLLLRVKRGNGIIFLVIDNN